MTAARVVGALVGFGTFCALLGATFMWRVEVRHSAPYGFSKTVDFERGLAVPGGYVTANYPNFDRVDLDLRAYDAAASYDLTLHIRPAAAGAEDLRVVDLRLDGEAIFHRKTAFGNPFTTVRFPPIADSAGRTYYVWVERGPRNRESVVTVWSIKSYSTVPARRVLGAVLNRAGDAWGIGWMASAVVTAAAAFSVASGWLMASVVSGGPGPTRLARGGQGSE